MYQMDTLSRPGDPALYAKIQLVSQLPSRCLGLPVCSDIIGHDMKRLNRGFEIDPKPSWKFGRRGLLRSPQTACDTFSAIRNSI
jgi:hypothetical protein